MPHDVFGAERVKQKSLLCILDKKSGGPSTGGSTSAVHSHYSHYEHQG